MNAAWLADLVAVVHLLYVLGAVLPVPLVIVGAIRGWPFVHGPAFRIAHLAMVGFVALESLLGAACPLTVLEVELRERAGEGGYGGSFVGHWVDRLLFYDLPPAFFTVVYVAFALLVIGLWFAVPPRFRPRA